MNNQKIINRIIWLLGLACIIFSLTNLITILNLFLLAKPELDRIATNGFLPSVWMPAESILLLLIGAGFIKQEHWARSGFIVFSCISAITAPYLIYKKEFGGSAIGVILFCGAGTIFLFLPSVKNIFLRKLETKYSKILSDMKNFK